MPYEICFAYLNARGRSLLIAVPPRRHCSNNCLKENAHDKWKPLEGPTEVTFYVIALHWKNVTGFSNDYCLNTVIIQLRLLLTFKNVLVFISRENSKLPGSLWVSSSAKFSPGVQGVCQDMQTADDGSGVAPYKTTQKTSIWREHTHWHPCLGHFPDLNWPSHGSNKLMSVYVPNTQQPPIKQVS